MVKKDFKNLRSRIPLADKRSQIYLSLTLILYLVIYTIGLLAVLVIPSAIRFTRQDLPIEEQFMASREFLFLDERVVPAIIIIMLIMSVHFLFISHRIFGPLARLRRILSEWAGEGTWPGPFRKRPKDFHGELFESFNSAAHEVGDNLRGARELTGEGLDILERIPGEGLPDKTSSDLEETRSMLRKALEKISRYSFRD